MVPARCIMISFQNQCKYNLLRRYIPLTNSNSRVYKSTTSKTTTDTLEDELDEPIKYSTTEAAKWKAQQTRQPTPDYVPWYQPHVINCSLAILFIYFFILREENDIDEWLSQDLSTHIKGIEIPKQSQISSNYDSYK